MTKDDDMLIILEGTDCAGKSTLSNVLMKHITEYWEHERVIELHVGAPTTHPYGEYIEPLTEYDPLLHEAWICDRWHVGESVYPTVYNRPTMLTTAMYEFINLFIRRRGGLVVNVSPPEDVLAERFDVRGDAVSTWTQVLQAKKLFDHHIGRLPSSHAMTLNTYELDNDPRRYISAIMRRAWQCNMSSIVYPLSYVGGPSIDHLVIFDNAADILAYEDLDFLAQSMDNARQRIGVIMASDFEEIDTMQQAYVSLGAPQLVLTEQAAERSGVENVIGLLPFGPNVPRLIPTVHAARESVPNEVYTRMITGG